MTYKSVSYRTDSNFETIKMGRELGTLLKQGDVIALVGELGSGKTWLTKGLALGLGVKENTVVTSPSFALLNEYSGHYTLYHIDAYRLDRLEDFISSGLEEYFYGEGIVAIEWADRWPEILPEWSVWIKIEIIDENCRKFEFSGKHYRSIEIINEICSFISDKIEPGESQWR